MFGSDRQDGWAPEDSRRGGKQLGLIYENIQFYNIHTDNIFLSIWYFRR